MPIPADATMAFSSDYGMRPPRLLMTMSEKMHIAPQYTFALQVETAQNAIRLMAVTEDSAPVAVPAAAANPTPRANPAPRTTSKPFVKDEHNPNKTASGIAADLKGFLTAGRPDSRPGTRASTRASVVSPC